MVLSFGLVLGLVFSLMTSPSKGSEPPVLLTMVGFQDAKEESKETYASVRAGVFDLNARVHMVWLDRLPPSSNTLEMAKTIAEADQSLAVFWKDGKHLFIYVPQLSTQTLLVRPIGASQKVGAADTVGLIVRGALGSLLTVPDSPGDNPSTPPDADAIPEEEPVDDAADEEEQAPLFATMPTIEESASTADTLPEVEAETADLTPEKKETDKTDLRSQREAQPQAQDEQKDAAGATPTPKPTDKPPQTTDWESKRLLAELLYGLDNVDETVPPLHLGRITFGVRLLRRIYVTVDYSLSMPVEVTAKSSGGTLKLNRYPFSIGGRAYLFSRGRWHLGLGALIETNIIRETITAGDDWHPAARKGERKTQVSIVPVGHVDLRLIGPLYAELHIGMRILVSGILNYSETIDNEGVSLYSPWIVQLRLALGLKILFG